VIERFARFPAALASQARSSMLGGTVPALLAHPDWKRPAPVAIWMHGRTVNKELDPGRYLRWIRAGIAVCAVDLPAHGERAELERQSPSRTLEVLAQMVAEIDQIVESLADPKWGGAFDLDRMAIGGMSAGGMAALRRLCDPHPFVCAAVEATTGNLAALYHPDAARPWPVSHPAERVRPLDPMQNLDHWRPIPLLALHSESDRVVPIAGQREFIQMLRHRYAASGADAGMIEFMTWPETGAAEEHSGFGKFSNDAKNAQTDFLSRHLNPSPSAS
jgi:alpha-beta hydrolase superfamily lysophospholipase